MGTTDQPAVTHATTCRLCVEPADELQMSHVLSKWGYKRLLDRTQRNQAPVHLGAGVAFRSSKQIVEALLCRDCERILATGGEEYAAKIAFANDGNCPLYAVLGHASAVHALPHAPAPLLLPATELDVEKLVHFAMGILWRASVSSEAEVAEFSLGGLEPLVAEFIRGKAAFPPNVCVQLTVMDEADDLDRLRFSRTITAPCTLAQDGFEVHGFLFCGLIFYILAGPSIPDSELNNCLFPTTNPRIVVAAANHITVIRNLVLTGLAARDAT